MSKSFLSFATLAGLTVSACCFVSFSATAETGFDVNDVAVLFAMNKHGDPVPNIALSGRNAHEPLLSKPLFNQIDAQVQKIEKNQVPERFEYEMWRLFAFRYDPCFPVSNPKEGSPACTEVVRLIAQPSAPFAIDVAMHLVYQLSPQKASAQSMALGYLKKIRDLSKSLGFKTQGVSLQPHPALVGDSTQKMATIFKEAIFDLCSESKLVEVTFADVIVNQKGPWFMIGGEIRNKKWIPQPIPLTPGKSLMQTINDSGFVDQVPVSKTTNMSWFMTDPEESAKNTRALTKDDVDGLFRVANPDLANPRNTDCASCHVQGSVFKRKGAWNFLSPFLAKASPQSVYKMPFGITGFVDHLLIPALNPDDELLGYDSNVRLFGYEGNQPLVGIVTAQSAASVAASVNQLMVWAPPTNRDCSSPQVFECFNRSGDFQNIFLKNTDETCLKFCKQTTN